MLLNVEKCGFVELKEEPKETIPKHLLKGAMNLPMLNMDHN